MNDTPLRDAVISAMAPSSFEADQYRSLRHAVEELRVSGPSRVIAITSPGQGDGKTVTALNLAATLAQRKGARVLLIDADLRKCSIAEHLNLYEESGCGLAELLEREHGVLAHATRHVPEFNLSVIPSTAPRIAAFDLLSSPRLESVIAAARQAYDFVVIDTPPVVALPDSRVFARWIDAYIVVVAAGKTSRRILSEALTILDPSKVAGFVLNGDRRRVKAYYQ